MGSFWVEILEIRRLILLGKKLKIERDKTIKIAFLLVVVVTTRCSAGLILQNFGTFDGISGEESLSVNTENSEFGHRGESKQIALSGQFIESRLWSIEKTTVSKIRSLPKNHCNWELNGRRLPCGYRERRLWTSKKNQKGFFGKFRISRIPMHGIKQWIFNWVFIYKLEFLDWYVGGTKPNLKSGRRLCVYLTHTKKQFFGFSRLLWIWWNEQNQGFSIENFSTIFKFFLLWPWFNKSIMGCWRNERTIFEIFLMMSTFGAIGKSWFWYTGQNQPFWKMEFKRRKEVFNWNFDWRIETGTFAKKMIVNVEMGQR